MLNNDAFCKRLHIDHDKKFVELISDNPDYQPIIVTKNDNLFTMGKVLGTSSKAVPDK
ncbi:MAG TPA: S24 family peptidase [Firmicutes bacterium]|nr:S24 family peptidase [Bacillota bacterium]